MKEGWQIKKIGEVASVVNGGTPSTSNPKFWDGGIEWLTPKDMGKLTDKYVSCGERTISQEGVDNSSAKILPPYSVILSSRAPIGYVAINTLPMATNQGCKGLIPSQSITAEYLLYFLLKSTKLLNDLGTGATFKELSGGKLGEILIPVPSVSEQQRIVSLLDAEFAKIDALKANAEKNLQNAKDLFQAALKKSFSGSNTILGNVLNLRRGHDLTHGEMKDGTIPVAGSGGVIGYHNEATPILPCITVGRSGSVGKVRIYETCWAHNTVLYVDDFKENDPYYLMYLLLSLDLQKQGGGCGVPTLNRNNLHPITIGFCNDVAEQKKVVIKLDVLNEKCKTLQANYEKTLSLCDDLKHSLLKKAFDGEL